VLQWLLVGQSRFSVLKVLDLHISTQNCSKVTPSTRIM
jgi:hypothetical protein